MGRQTYLVLDASLPKHKNSNRVKVMPSFSEVVVGGSGSGVDYKIYYLSQSHSLFPKGGTVVLGQF